jgi:aspartate/tyrosine/aromatic aminotransferase
MCIAMYMADEKIYTQEDFDEAVRLARHTVREQFQSDLNAKQQEIQSIQKQLVAAIRLRNEQYDTLRALKQTRGMRLEPRTCKALRHT